MYDTVDVLAAVELLPLKWLILCYVKFTPVIKKKRENGVLY